MKCKCRLFIYTLLLFVLTAGMALYPAVYICADSLLIPPEYPVMPEDEYDFTYRVLFRGSGSVETVTPAVLGEEGEWKVEEREGCRYRFRLCNVISYENNTYRLSTIYHQQEYTSETIFKYTIREPGMYFVFCYIEDNAGEVTRIDTRFTVEEREGVETVSSRVSDIVGECLSTAAGEYEIALWLHDWITHHSYYDYSYCSHGADSILFRGLGVCDSYSKLYLLLLEEAGIEVTRVTNSTHAWNAAKIDGEWCQVDTTWDDPGTAEEAVSGRENHDYFGMNDELMHLDHVYETSVTCTSLLNCAIRREETYKLWLSHIWQEIEDAFLNGNIYYEADTMGMIMGPGGHYTSESYVNRRTTIAVIIMSRDEWSYQGGRTVRADFTYDTDEKIICYNVIMDRIDLVLPEGIQRIEEEAFAGDESIYGVEIPESVESVGARAFADCRNLMWVVVHSDGVVIEGDAFEGVPEGYVVVRE